jgi:PEP-CTERM motif
MTWTNRLALAVAIAVSSGAAAHASVLTVSAAVGGAPTGVTYANFDNLPVNAPGAALPNNTGGSSNGVSVSFTGDGGAVQGALGGKYAAPYLSNNNGMLFGDSETAPDSTTYLSTGIGSVTLTFAGSEQYLGLLWGSVDSYNTLSFYNGSTLVGSVTGSNVTGSPTGDQGVNGTYYVNITSSLAFNTVVATSSQYAFEFDNVAYDSGRNIGLVSVPEPATLGLLGLGLLGAIGLRRRQLAR